MQDDHAVAATSSTRKGVVVEAAIGEHTSVEVILLPLTGGVVNPHQSVGTWPLTTKMGGQGQNYGYKDYGMEHVPHCL